MIGIFILPVGFYIFKLHCRRLKLVRNREKYERLSYKLMSPTSRKARWFYAYNPTAAKEDMRRVEGDLVALHIVLGFLIIATVTTVGVYL